MGLPPTVTGISPKEATAGTKITIRGENLGVSQQDIIGVLINGSDCLLTSEWKSSNKIIALCPGLAPEGKGDIIVATKSGGIGSCTVQLRIFKESVGPLKEVAVWCQEKYYTRRKNRVFSPTGMEHEDALGLSVEGMEAKPPEEQLNEMFPGKSGEIGSEMFEPAYFLLENHGGTTFEDLQAGLGYLRRKVDGENESQLSFIKANVNSIMDQLDTLKSIKNRYEVDNRQYGRDPTAMVEKTISAAKKEADQMFNHVLGGKDRADSTRNALNVLNRFKFLFNLPANIEQNLAKNDYDRIIDEYERAKSLYGGSDSKIFNIYLKEIENRVEMLREKLRKTLEDPNLSAEQQKKLIANLVQLNEDSDPAWNCLHMQYSHVLGQLNSCRDQHLEKNRASNREARQNFLLSPTSKGNVFPTITSEESETDVLPECVIFVQEVTKMLSQEFPNLWRLGQSYFKGNLVVEPDSGKHPVFKEMILNAIKYFSSLIRCAIIPHTLPEGDVKDYGDWGADNEKIAAQWLPSCLRHIRKSYAKFIELDLPGQALDIIKHLTTDLRIQCLQMIFQTVIDQAHLLHEKEEWNLDITDQVGAITDIPDMFESLVSQSVQLIKEALLTADNREEDILSYQNASDDLELLIQNVLSSFAFTLENAAVENYNSLASVPSDSTRLLLCMNNCKYTQTHVLPKIQKLFQEVGELSLEKPISEANKCYIVLHRKLLEAYLELKCDPIVAIIEPSMYIGKFDWARCPKPGDARDYVKEIIHNVIVVHSEVDRISALENPEHNYISLILQRVVESLAEEVNRLFCCISKMNSNGCIQAWVDIHCLQAAFKPFLTKQADEFLSDAAKPLYDLERPGDKEVITVCVNEFNKRMKLHLTVLDSYAVHV